MLRYVFVEYLPQANFISSPVPLNFWYVFRCYFIVNAPLEFTPMNLVIQSGYCK